jgi:hypothetical protein
MNIKMVSEQLFYLRQKGQEDWVEWGDHPARPLEGIVSLWGGKQGLRDETIVQLRTYPDGPITEAIYRKDGVEVL